MSTFYSIPSPSIPLHGVDQTSETLSSNAKDRHIRKVLAALKRYRLPLAHDHHTPDILREALPAVDLNGNGALRDVEELVDGPDQRVPALLAKHADHHLPVGGAVDDALGAVLLYSYEIKWPLMRCRWGHWDTRD